jgi:hypothetical protein
MSCACIEHLDFSNSLDLGELDIQPFKQIQHNFIGYTSLTEGPKLVAKEEEKRDFAVRGLKYFFLLGSVLLFPAVFATGR